MEMNDILSVIKNLISTNSELQIIADNNYSITLKNKNGRSYDLKITPNWNYEDFSEKEILAYTE